MAPSRSNSFYLTISHIQQRGLARHWLRPLHVVQHLALIGWEHFYLTISHIETLTALQEGILYSARFSIQISMLNSGSAYGLKLEGENQQSYNPGSGRQESRSGELHLGRCWVGDECAINKQFDQQLYNYSSDNISNLAQWNMNIDNGWPGGYLIK